MRFKFSKMHGAGNDFVVIDGIKQTIQLNVDQIKHIADRHFGVGCDQLLLVEKPQHPAAEFRYRIFNADGSEVEQCGNGARCFARFVFDQGLTQNREIRVETQGGLIVLMLTDDGRVTVNMGVPRFLPEQLPYLGQGELIDTLTVGSHDIQISTVSMGNPHAVLVVNDVVNAPVTTLGPQIESHTSFPKRVNVGFVEVANKHNISLRVFERGSGETLSCGTGACAAAVSVIRRDLAHSPVNVTTRGGLLTIEWAGEGHSVFMTGPAVTVFSGEINL